MAIAALGALGVLLPLGMRDGMTDDHASSHALDGEVVRVEVTDVWLPQALRSLSRNQWTGTSAPRRIQALRDGLRRGGLEYAWIVVFTTSYSRDGQSSRMAQIRYPARSNDSGGWILDAILEASEGRPPAVGPMDFSCARFRVIPQHLLSWDLQQVIVELELLQDAAGARERKLGLVPPD